MCEEKIITSVRLKKEIHKELKLWAVKQDMSIGDLIEYLLQLANKGANDEEQ
jgi:predicted HicB family RNase H-like nuclease